MTAQIINFAAALNARRAGAEIAQREAAQADRIEAKVDKLAEAVDGLFGLPLNRDAARDSIAKEEGANAGRFMPAYCDPANETSGAKHDATRDLDVAEIAKRMRADIKAATASGLIPAGVKTSVRIQRFSGGRSIDISVNALPEGFRIYSDKAASWLKQFPNRQWDMPLSRDDQHAPEYLNLMARLKAIHSAYNRDNSDSMVDYFDVRYYGDAEIDWRVRDAIATAEVEASPGDVWAEGCR